MFLVLSALVVACVPATTAASLATPTGPLVPQDRAVQMGLSLCSSGHITSAVEPRLDTAELTTNQSVALRLGRYSWSDLPAGSPVWLIQYSGAFSISPPPAGPGTASPALGPFPACWAIIEARTGARGTVYIPQK